MQGIQGHLWITGDKMLHIHAKYSQYSGFITKLFRIDHLRRSKTTPALLSTQIHCESGYN